MRILTLALLASALTAGAHPIPVCPITDPDACQPAHQNICTCPIHYQALPLTYFPELDRQ